MGLGSPFGGLGSPSSILEAKRYVPQLFFGSHSGAILVKNPEKTPPKINLKIDAGKVRKMRAQSSEKEANMRSKDTKKMHKNQFVHKHVIL